MADLPLAICMEGWMIAFTDKQYRHRPLLRVRRGEKWGFLHRLTQKLCSATHVDDLGFWQLNYNYNDFTLRFSGLRSRRGGISYVGKCLTKAAVCFFQKATMAKISLLLECEVKYGH